MMHEAASLSDIAWYRGPQMCCSNGEARSAKLIITSVGCSPIVWAEWCELFKWDRSQIIDHFKPNYHQQDTMNCQRLGYQTSEWCCSDGFLSRECLFLKCLQWRKFSSLWRSIQCKLHIHLYCIYVESCYGWSWLSLLNFTVYLYFKT